MFRPKRMLVTGAAGFIGSHFVKYVLANDLDVEVISYDLLTYAGSMRRLQALDDLGRHTFVQGDICDAVAVKQAMEAHTVDTIVHFAAESHVDHSIADPQIFVETNVLGTFQLLESAREYWLKGCGWSEMKCRFHHVSTDEVYGVLQTGDPAFTECTPYDPRSPYAASKAASDHLVRAYGNTYGLPVTMSNCSNNFGPQQHDEKFIPVVISACLHQQPIPIYGNGRNVRDWLYVEDHCDAIMTILKRGSLGQRYNIGGGCELENIALAESICDVMDSLFPGRVVQYGSHRDLIQMVSDRPGHDFRYAIDGRKMLQAFGWSPSGDFNEHLRETIIAYCRVYDSAFAFAD